MLQLINRTPFAAQIMLLPDAQGVDTLFAVVKGTFSISEGLRPAAEQVPVALTDEHHGDPAASSVRIPSDVSLGKPGTDVVMLGTAWAPGGRAAWQMDVSLAVGPVASTVRVFGDRVWQRGAAGASVAWVKPFEHVPLVWERAFGGSDQTEKGPTAEVRNPVGTGFRAAAGTKPLDGMPLANIEDPSALISSWKDTPAPAGFAPVAAHWEPRKSFAGTYDEAWQRQRAPYLPSDFDARFFQIAPAGMVTPAYLQGGEWVDVRGATPHGVLQFQLPTVRVLVTYRLTSGSEQRAGVLDTLVVEPDAARVVLVWRTRLTCDKKALKVQEVEASMVGVA